MVVPGLSIELFEFQEKAVINLLDLTTKKGWQTDHCDEGSYRLR